MSKTQSDLINENNDFINVFIPVIATGSITNNFLSAEAHEFSSEVYIDRMCKSYQSLINDISASGPIPVGLDYDEAKKN